MASLLQLLILPFCPESPAWLYITKSRKEDSAAALRSLWGDVDISQQLDSYAAEVVEQENRPKVVFQFSSEVFISV